MQDQIAFDRFLSFINCQLDPSRSGARCAAKPKHFRAVTISREAGSGAHEVGEALAGRLGEEDKTPGRPWTLFDRKLVNRVLEDHNLPARMADLIPEDRMTELQDAVDELLGLRPGSWALVQQISETILRLVELGNVILIGRGANIVTRSRNDVLHVRLVAPLELRVQRLQEARELSRKAALAALRREDLGRVRYVKKYLKQNVDDPELYHLTLNTGLICLPQAVDILTRLVLAGPEGVSP